jgi:CRP/FNR family cyclic AMP-dependent transcriptional regulator
MNKFRKLGLISYNGKIEVHRSLLNAVLYEKSQIKLEESPLNFKFSHSLVT